MSVKVQAVDQVTDELVDAAGRLLRQLSVSAAHSTPRAWPDRQSPGQDARGQGIGTALTMAALDQAQAQGARSIDLTSRASRVAANRLYQQLGFQLRDSNVHRYELQPRPH